MWLPKALQAPVAVVLLPLVVAAFGFLCWPPRPLPLPCLPLAGAMVYILSAVAIVGCYILWRCLSMVLRHSGCGKLGLKIFPQSCTKRYLRRRTQFLSDCTRQMWSGKPLISAFQRCLYFLNCLGRSKVMAVPVWCLQMGCQPVQMKRSAGYLLLWSFNWDGSCSAG